MKSLVGWMLVALLAMPASVMAQAGSLPSQPHLLVKGEARREVMPDRFSLRIMLSSVDADAGVARAKVQAHAEQVLVAYRAHHALADSVQASSLSIQPDYGYQDSQRFFKGTQVSRTLSARFASLDDVRGLLAGLKTSEELQVSGITPGYHDEAAVRAELKRQAAAQTRESARRLADAYGVRLAGLYTVSEVAPEFAYGIRAGSWLGADGGEADQARPTDIASAPAPAAPRAESLEAGSLTLTENIYAVFLIAQ